MPIVGALVDRHTPEHRLMIRAGRRALARMLAECLTPAQRLVIAATVGLGADGQRPDRAIAASLRCSTSTVKRLRKSAFAILATRAGCRDLLRDLLATTTARQTVGRVHRVGGSE